MCRRHWIARLGRPIQMGSPVSTSHFLRNVVVYSSPGGGLWKPGQWRQSWRQYTEVYINPIRLHNNQLSGLTITSGVGYAPMASY